MTEPPSPNDRWENPLTTRYASAEMSSLFSARSKFATWRRLWLWLAEAERQLGLPIPDASLEALRAHLVPTDVELEAADRYERETKHDVMAHLHALGDVAPAARGVLHLGATSAFVGDNGDLILLREALRLLARRTVRVMGRLARFARAYRDLPCLGFTHFQAAQPTTVGKRACLWLQDLALDHRELVRRADELRFLGAKGATGTQASFVALFDGEADKAERLDELVAEKAGFADRLLISGQTYTRKQDALVLGALAGLASSASKFANDVRLLQHLKEVEEPFGKKQVGSSAMPYKRNPMKCERINALARWLLSVSDSGNWTHATQWFERTLDDSANRRLTIPEAFLTADAILLLVANIAGGIEVRDGVVARHVAEQMPFMATERWLMLGVQAGGDRQALHEVIRRYSRAVSADLERGAANDLLERLAQDPAFARVDAAALRRELDPRRYVGRAPEQVMEYVQGPLDQLLTSLKDIAVRDDAKVTV